MNRIVTLLLAIMASFTLSANSESKGAALDELIIALDRIETLSASFVQYSTDPRGARIQDSRGELMADRGGKFFWHTFEPLEQIVVSDGLEVTVYDPDLEQATVQAVGAQLQATPAILFSGDTQKIGELFEVEVRRFEPAFRQFLLIPKSSEGLFERLQVRFNGNNIGELRITDALGQESTMSFIQTQVNLELPKDAFSIKLPEGTDVIRDLQIPEQ